MVQSGFVFHCRDNIGQERGSLFGANPIFFLQTMEGRLSQHAKGEVATFNASSATPLSKNNATLTSTIIPTLYPTNNSSRSQ